MLSLWAPPCPIAQSVVLRNVAKPAIYPNNTPRRELYVSKYDAIRILTKKYPKQMATNKYISTFKTETVSATEEVG